MNRLPRRTFLQTGALAGLGGAAWLARFPAVSAAEAKVDPRSVVFRSEIEPLVRLLEDTPRDRLLEEMASRIQRGTTYREVLTALLLAGVRNIQPRPVGFKFHAVLVVNSAHLASQNSPDADRWLPIFWALDYFKSSQARDVSEGDWTMSALDEGAIPSADRARTAFTDAMDRWEEPRADLAAAGLVRALGAQEVFDRFCLYGARDFRDIGHKAIYVANSWRTLQNIGWQHAEPVIRSLAYALLDRRGAGNPAENDYEEDRPGRRNLERVSAFRADWQRGRREPGVELELLATLRTGSWDDAAVQTLELVNGGSSVTVVWDAIFLHAGELLMRRPGIASLHASTTANALHYAFQQTANDETRRFLLLQAASFMPLFARAADAGGESGSRIDQLEPLALAGTPSEGLAEIFADISGDQSAAARKTLAWLQSNADARAFIDGARRLIYLKGRDSHDYKFSAAVLEDYAHLAPGLRDRFLAASVHWLKGSGAPDSPLVARTRALL